MITPLVSFPTLADFELALRNDRARADEVHWSMDGSFAREADQQIEAGRALVSRGLPPLVSARAFSLILGVSPKLIPAMTHSPEVYWRSFNLLKKDGTPRLITTPRAFLKTVQLYLLRFVLDRVPESPCAYGFTVGKGALKNAAQHLGQRFVWNTDIQNFFPSIGFHQVATVFRDLGFPEPMPDLLAALCTFDRRLPQGAPTSPKLSNLVFAPFDQRLQSIAIENRLRYSRYADDITFSGPNKLTSALFESVRRTLITGGFRLNLEKTRLQGPSEARYVTGYVVNEKIHPDRETRRMLRAQFHALSLAQSVTVEQFYGLQGWASYVFSYDKMAGARYFKIIAEARGKVIAASDRQRPQSN